MSDVERITADDANMVGPIESEIRVAFASQVYPGDKAVLDSTDPLGCHFHFVGKSWQDLDAKTLDLEYHVIYYWKAPALHYFLPAFLIHSLHGMQEESIMMEEATISNLIPPQFKNLSEPYLSKLEAWTNQFRERFRGLTEKQYHCIGAYMDYMLHHQRRANYFDLSPSDSHAIVNFWHDPDLRATFFASESTQE